MNVCDYTPEIKRCIDILKYRMEYTLLEFDDSDIQVFDIGEYYYILANPIVGEEHIFDDSGNYVNSKPLRNISIIHQRVQVMRKELCIKMSHSGEVNEAWCN